MTERAKASTKAARPAYECDVCGHRPAKWVGRCPECNEWGSVIEVLGMPGTSITTRALTPRQPARPIATISAEPAKARRTGVSEFDRVLGGGLVPGGVVLLAGEPGVGKSTLLLDVAQQWARQCDGTSGSPGPALVISGEESTSQVRLRADRIGALHDKLYLAAETDLGAVLAHLDDVKPGLLVVDSVQTVATGSTEGVAGGVTQVRAVTAALVAIAKEREIATVLVGHVTKDGNVAGPRVLEHLVDVVLQFEGDKHSTLRLVRGLKNRFGAADEVGCFEMHESGIISLPDPSGLFLNRNQEAVPGTCVTVAMEGRRALLTEVQALIGAAVAGNPRRTVSGLDGARVSMILAVLGKYNKNKLAEREIFAATVGGMRITEPAADLGITLALSSATVGLAMPPDLVAVGEVGLTGEIRRVSAVPQRLAEAARLGFKYALVPPGCARDINVGGLAIREAGNVPDALSWAASLAAKPNN